MTKKQRQILAAIGAKIRERRKAFGWTQQDMQRKTGINHGDISRIENGQRNVELITLINIADALGVEVRRLF